MYIYDLPTTVEIKRIIVENEVGTLLPFLSMRCNFWFNERFMRLRTEAERLETLEVVFKTYLKEAAYMLEESLKRPCSEYYEKLAQAPVKWGEVVEAA